MADPLVGKRQQINDGTLSLLIYPDPGGTEQDPLKRCPVAPGDTFLLRSCAIEIARVERFRQHKHPTQKWWFRAEFLRYGKRADQLYILPRSASAEIVKDLKGVEEGSAMRAQDDPNAATLVGSPMDNPSNLRQPPEPEGIPHEDVVATEAYQRSRARYEEEVTEERLRERNAPVATRLERIKELARENHVDISAQMAVIDKQLAKAERKVAKSV